MIEVEKIDEVYVRIYAQFDQELELKTHFECFTANYKFHPKYKARIWNGKVSYFNILDKKLPIGLLGEFHNFCKKFDYQYKLNFHFAKPEITEDDVSNFFDLAVKNEKIEKRKYQIESVVKSIQRKRGTLVLPTGSGKSLTIYLTLRMLLTQDPEKQMILIVPTQMLVEQMYSDFKEYGWDNIEHYATKLYTGKKPDFRKNLLITTWQSVHKKHISFFEKYNVLMVDEAHGAKTMSLQNVAKKCVNAEYRFGYTGTLPREKCDLYNIHGFIGPLIYSTKAKELIDAGVLSKIKIVNVLMKYPDEIIKKNRNRPWSEEEDTVINYSKRNKVLKHIIGKVNPDDNTLILCSKRAHLKRIVDYLVENLDPEYEVLFIHGLVKAKERERIRKLINEKSKVILVATYATMATGVNIPKIHNVILASSYKSEIKILQSIGRGLRKHITKTRVMIFDLVDYLCWKKRTGNWGRNYMYLHHVERKKYYEEQGFENVDLPIKLE